MTQRSLFDSLPPDDPDPSADSPYSVSQLTQRVRHLLEGDVQLQGLWVQGEVSNMRPASSGHWYFSIKDGQSELRCVMWRSSAQRQTYTPRQGDAVTVRGKITVYAQRGEYQLQATQVQPQGVGDLHQQFERLKARLHAEGLFDEARKRPLPAMPRRIGVVTSASTAAFQDTLKVLRRRFPLADVLLSHTLVQGTDAPPQIVRAIQRLNRFSDADVILVIRGGGSIEDLWCFNDEAVARAIADSRIPVISGVGHEIDFTLADFAADLRAPTPSAAAEQAVPDVDGLRYAVRDSAQRLEDALRARLEAARSELHAATHQLDRLNPAREIDARRRDVDALSDRGARALDVRLTRLQDRLSARVDALDAANPESLLARGYAIVQRADTGQRLESASDAQPGDRLRLRLSDGTVDATVNEK